MQPFASLIDRVQEHVPRLLINREVAGAVSLNLDIDMRAYMELLLTFPFDIISTTLKAVGLISSGNTERTEMYYTLAILTRAWKN